MQIYSKKHATHPWCCSRICFATISEHVHQLCTCLLNVAKQVYMTCPTNRVVLGLSSNGSPMVTVWKDDAAG